MSVQTDIDWIKTELDSVRDPLLIETFKNLLNYRRQLSSSNQIQQILDKMIDEGEEDIENGDLLSSKELRSEVSSWRK